MDPAVGDAVIKCDFSLTMVYARDASWHPRSKAGGKTLRYHACNPDDMCLAACSRMIMLHEDTAESVLSVADDQLCSRPACVKRFAAMTVYA